MWDLKAALDPDSSEESLCLATLKVRMKTIYSIITAKVIKEWFYVSIKHIRSCSVSLLNQDSFVIAIPKAIIDYKDGMHCNML